MPREQSYKSNGRRKGPGTLLIPRTCGDGQGLFCNAAWAGIAGRLGLSPRQKEVARYVLADQSDDQIAQALGLSRGTVQTHMERLRDKLHVHSRIQLVLRVVAAYLDWRIESPPPSGCPVKSRLESS